MNSKLKLPKGLFELTDEQLDMSKMIYNGKTLKCLVAPYHSYRELEAILPHTKTTFLFPEKEMTQSQSSAFISMVVNMNTTEEIKIITTNMSIITDMIDGSVRVLTEGGDIVESPSKTFAANIHDIRYFLLENELHQLPKSGKEDKYKIINDVITRINSGTITTSEYKEFKMKIDLIGEPIVRNKLLEMLGEVNII